MSEDSDSDEPLPSGSGDVNKDVSISDLYGWSEVLAKWKENLSCRPKQLSALVYRGIPQALRGEIWLMLVNADNQETLMNSYRVLVMEDSKYEKIIRRDINRTFPGHEYFHSIEGQESLYKVCKAYSNFDQEIGYCQGLSFIVAALLLHMPEEQSFFILVKIMNDYKLRSLFKSNFDELYKRFYQLDRLLDEQHNDLLNYFQENGIETHMFASQWFLTLFTAKFPLHVVFTIIDIFLLDGEEILFKVSLALLQLSKRDLLALDFEGILKYFRVHLPKKYLSEESAKQLLRTVNSIKVKKLAKYESDYITLRDQMKMKENPIERLTKDNKRLHHSNMRLEQENDDLAHELVSSKILLRKQLDIAEDKVDTLQQELLAERSAIIELEEEKKRLEDEVIKLKDICRRELERSGNEISRNVNIISDYKQICSQLSLRLDEEQKTSQEKLKRLMKIIRDCEHCKNLCKNERSNVNGMNSVSRSNSSTTIENNNDNNNIDNSCDLDNINYDNTSNGATAIDNNNKMDDDNVDVDEIFECLNFDENEPEVQIKRVRELELELARTKLALVETECKNQNLFHHLTAAQAEMQSSKNTWFNKTLTSIKEATKKEFSRDKVNGHSRRESS